MPTDNLDARVPRPPDRWRAWVETADYIARQTRRPGTLHLSWHSQGIDAPWMAQLNWVDNVERVGGQPTAGDALIALWKQIESHYRLFPNATEARRAPRAYPPDHWFTIDEETLLARIQGVMTHACHTSVLTMLITYQAGSTRPRVQARLICHETGLTVRGQGSTLLQACQDLYPRAMGRLSTV